MGHIKSYQKIEKKVKLVEKHKPDYYDNLEKTYLKIWGLLESGLKNRDAPFHIPVFICCYKDESDGRIIVLRGVDKKEKKIRFHTDIRSNKVKFLKSNSNGALLFYDKIEKIQLRILGNTKINYQSKITENSWKKTAHMSRQCYLGQKPPGSDYFEPTSGLSNDIDNFNFTIEDSEIGYKNFCVIDFFIESVEWLYLAAKGHRRAFFRLEKNIVQKKWLIP